MKAEQLSIFLENAPGRLLEVTAALAKNQINIRALSLADTIDYGVLRLITDKPEEARRVLSEEGFTARTAEVLAVAIPDEPGGLARILKLLADGGINVEYMYASVGRAGREVIMIFRLDDTDRGMALIGPEAGRILSHEELSRY